MTVKELIEALSEFDGNMRVIDQSEGVDISIEKGVDDEENPVVEIVLDN